jgi:hypothetical protein
MQQIKQKRREVRLLDACAGETLRGGQPADFIREESINSALVSGRPLGNLVFS